MLIGKSLSMCVSAICRGEVQESDVEYILTNTKAESREALIVHVIENYQMNSWLDYPEMAKEVCLRLWDAGKIKQPRLEGKEGHYPFPIWEEPIK